MTRFWRAKLNAPAHITTTAMADEKTDCRLGFKHNLKSIAAQLQANLRISAGALQALDQIAQLLARRTARFAALHARRLGRATTSAANVQAVIPELIGDTRNELVKHARSELVKAVDRAAIAETNGQSRSAQAGLSISVSRAEHHLRRECGRVGQRAPVALAAVVEYLTAEIIELAARNARANQRVTLFPADITSTASDGDLSKLFAHHRIEISGGGVLRTHHVERKSTPIDRKIAELQKQTELLAQKLPFERHVRAGLAAHVADFRLESGVSSVLQDFVEHRATELFALAAQHMEHAGRKMVSGKDVLLALKSGSPALKRASEETFGDDDNPILPKPALIRCARRGRVESVTAEGIAVAAQAMGHVTSDVCRSIAHELETLRTKTMTADMLRGTLERLGYCFIF